MKRGGPPGSPLLFLQRSATRCCRRTACHRRCLHGAVCRWPAPALVVRFRHCLRQECRDGVPIVEVASRFGVSRQAVHRWLRWYEAQGLAGLVDRSHRPPRCSHQMDAAVEVWVLEARRRNPDWGPRRLVHEASRARHRASSVTLGHLSGAQAGRLDRPAGQAPARPEVPSVGAGRGHGALAVGRRGRRAARRRHRVQDPHRDRRPLPVRRLRRGDASSDQPRGVHPLRGRDGPPRRPAGDPHRQRQGLHGAVRRQAHRGAVRPDLPRERDRPPAHGSPQPDDHGQDRALPPNAAVGVPHRTGLRRSSHRPGRARPVGREL